MAELADALDLGSSEATRTGSSPARRTKIGILILILCIYIKTIHLAPEMVLFYGYNCSKVRTNEIILYCITANYH